MRLGLQVVLEARHGLHRGGAAGFETGVADEAFRIGAQIERDLLQELVDEIWWDMLKPLQCM